jgi:hypothetical protein
MIQSNWLYSTGLYLPKGASQGLSQRGFPIDYDHDVETWKRSLVPLESFVSLDNVRGFQMFWHITKTWLTRFPHLEHFIILSFDIAPVAVPETCALTKNP